MNYLFLSLWVLVTLLVPNCLVLAISESVPDCHSEEQAPQNLSSCCVLGLAILPQVDLVELSVFELDLEVSSVTWGISQTDIYSFNWWILPKPPDQFRVFSTDPILHFKNIRLIV